MSYYFVFDVGGTSIKYALMTDKGEFVHQDGIETPRTNIEDFIEIIGSLVDSYKKEYRLKGVAASLPGAVEPDTGYIGGGSAVPYIHGPNVKKMLEERTGLPASIENDANCAGLAEGWLGAAKDVQNYICIVIGTGIGGCVVLNKKILRGKHYHGGEFGYMIMEDIFEEPYGKIWSSTASTQSLVRNVAKAKRMDYSSLNGKKVFEMAETGDKVVRQEIRKFYKRLATGIFNLQYIIDPEKILIGGAISERDEVIEEINRLLKQMKNRVSTLDIKVERCAYKNDANLVGALYHFLTSNS
ncbi:ROK family protein [Fonticella tunisiensis]|uniref:Putative NBD/HSP70 family sugar kinase n=1 Tax=Fonticella tunisiensis TaxID=1096341 RepID=A0A4V3ERP7_9CLOT|nr:ROK family protein [Fonticella tunisiensis]TDT46103.1 putative NBD/HSP70 family sugar kinase [Fonticella tunisiensis]